MNSPNILITNFCNQGCTYCFAKDLMKNKKIPREMSLKNFKILINKLKRSKKNIDTIKLLGGEPTLHTQFEEITNIVLNNFNCLQLFTNGIFSEKTLIFIKEHLTKIQSTFNITTPTFLYNLKKREMIIDRITELSLSSKVALSVTVDPTSDIQLLIKILTKRVLTNISFIRIGVANPILQQKVPYSFYQFKKTGKNIIRLTEAIRLLNKKVEISLNCGFIRCMFSDKSLDYLKKEKIIIIGWGCRGKTSDFDVKTNLDAVLCYPLSNETKDNLIDTNINKMTNKMHARLAIFQEYWSLNRCKKCPYYGPRQDQCPGPCLAYKHQLSYDSASKA